MRTATIVSSKRAGPLSRPLARHTLGVDMAKCHFIAANDAGHDACRLLTSIRHCPARAPGDSTPIGHEARRPASSRYGVRSKLKGHLCGSASDLGAPPML